MRTRAPLPEVPLGHPMAHQWADTGRAWSPRTSAENYTQEKRCVWCGETWFAGQDDEPRAACPDRPLSGTPEELAEWGPLTPELSPPPKTMDRHETETETYYLLLVTPAQLSQAGVEFAADQDQPVAIRYGVRVGDEPGTLPWFFEVVRREADEWQYALPFFEQRHIAAYKGRIERAANERKLRALIEAQVPDWTTRLREDEASLRNALANA